MSVPVANALHPGRNRFEVFDVARERLDVLGVHLACSSLPFSIHAPLVREQPDEVPSAVFFLADAPERREASFTALGATLARAARLGADHVVTHLNWTDDVASEREAERLAHDAAARLVALARLHGVALHVECGGYAGGFHRAAQFVALARAFPELGLCVDVAHLWLIAQVRDRCAYRDIAALAPYARSAHVWAARDLATYQRRGHVPLHPRLSPRDGWLDVRRALAPVLEAQPDCRVIFEYTWPAAAERRAQAGLAWANTVIEGLQARAR